jgi:hypothetical protein
MIEDAEVRVPLCRRCRTVSCRPSCDLRSSGVRRRSYTGDPPPEWDYSITDLLRAASKEASTSGVNGIVKGSSSTQVIPSGFTSSGVYVSTHLDTSASTPSPGSATYVDTTTSPGFPTHVHTSTSNRESLTPGSKGTVPQMRTKSESTERLQMWTEGRAVEDCGSIGGRRGGGGLTEWDGVVGEGDICPDLGVGAGEGLGEGLGVGDEGRGDEQGLARKKCDLDLPRDVLWELLSSHLTSTSDRRAMRETCR